VYTYKNVIEQTLLPGTKLHAAWAHLAAPPIARGYWRLPDDAKWVDALKCMMADEAHHRDVNHTFAIMSQSDPNPFAHHHKKDAAYAWRVDHPDGLPNKAVWKNAKKAVGAEE
jgi:hypothetical protein